MLNLVIVAGNVKWNIAAPSLPLRGRLARRPARGRPPLSFCKAASAHVL